MKNLNEYTVVVGYPFFLKARKWRGLAESAEDAVRIVFSLATNREAKLVEEYTGPKRHPDRVFEVKHGYNETAILYIES